tara:strand:+ start:65 stop:334 length:270 start_codon:yes stop_codon:yes gene_type:complete
LSKRVTRRDFRRESRGQHRRTLATDFAAIIKALANNEALEVWHRDHALTGQWQDHRDCHIWPDLVLIYRKPDDEVLQLVRLGSHSELSL